MRYAIIAVAAGAAVLLASELTDWAALRIFAVALLVGGAVGAGVNAGFQPQSAAVLRRVAAILTRTTICVIAVLLAAPMLGVLALSSTRAATRIFGLNPAAQVPLSMGGGIVALLLLMAAACALIVCIMAIRGKTPAENVEKPS